MAQPFGAFEPKFEQEAVAHWWSPTEPRGAKFELPDGVANCALLKGRFLGDLLYYERRIGGPVLASGRFLVDDNLGHGEFKLGSTLDVHFLAEYYGEDFYDVRIAPRGLETRSRTDPDTMLKISVDDRHPPPGAYVCAFRQKERKEFLMLSYFLTPSPPRPLRR
jgi:hypothetical protein